MSFRLPRLPASQPAWGLMQLWWQRVVEQIEAQETRQDDAITAIQAAQAAADAANAAAAAANTAALTAQAAADESASASSLSNSYVTGLTITAADAGADVTITISAHSRVYPQADGSNVTVAVDGGTLTGRAYSTAYYIFYDQASRAGGAVTYQSDTAAVAQTGDRHSVGAVTTPAPAAPASNGNVLRPPGYVEP